MKYFVFIFLFSLVNSGYTCEIVTHDKIYKINKILDDSVIKSSDCPSSIKDSFLDMVASGNGSIHSTHLANVLSTKENPKITIKPAVIQVETISDKLQEHFKTQSITFSNVSALYPYSALYVEKDHDLKFECKNCESSGRKNIKAMMGSQTVWLSATLMHKIKALKIKKNLSYHTPILTKDDFEIIETLEKDPSQLFTDLDNIKFFKLNRNLVEGRVLKVHDLRPKNLITTGQKIQVHVSNNSIKLKTVGIAKRGGKFGDYIEIENPKSKKIMMGKITGHNTAVIEL